MEDKTEIEKQCGEYKAKSEEYLNNWKRERADFANYKKEESKRLEEFVKFANVGLILEAVEVLDDLEIVAKNNENNEGLGPVLKKFQDSLAKYGVERIKTDGKFDPTEQEAVEGSEGGRIEEIRTGYRMNGRVIRPARVKIIK